MIVNHDKYYDMDEARLVTKKWLLQKQRASYGLTRFLKKGQNSYFEFVVFK